MQPWRITDRISGLKRVFICIVLFWFVEFINYCHPNNRCIFSSINQLQIFRSAFENPLCLPRLLVVAHTSKFGRKSGIGAEVWHIDWDV